MSKMVYSIPLALALLTFVNAQDQQQPATYPTWVTNDYSCVIKCMEDQFANTQPPAANDKVQGAMGCVRDACSKETAEGNVYQAHYIINMFNAIGSIYEPQSWQDGNAPDAKDLIAPEGWTQTQTTTTWTENDQPTTITTSVWAPPATPSAPPQPAETTQGAAAPTTQAAAEGSKAAGGNAVSSKATSANPSGSGNTNANGTGNGTGENGSGRIVPLDMGVSVLVGLGVVLLGGIAGGVGLVGL